VSPRRAWSVANSREERGKAIAQLAGMSHGAIVRELEAWTITADEIREESRELRRRRGEARTMLELIAAEVRNRRVAQPTVLTTSDAASSEAVA
jgi:hypothetical protein